MTTQMTLGSKLKTGFGAMALLTVLLGIAAVSAMIGLRSQFDAVVNRHAKKLDLASKISEGSAEMLGYDNGIMLRLAFQDTAAADKYKRGWMEAAKTVERSIQEMEPLMDRSGGESLDQVRNLFGRWRSGHLEMIRQIDAVQFDVANKTLLEMVPLAEQMQESSRQVVQAQRGRLSDAYGSVAALASIMLWVSIALAGLCLGIGAFVLVVVVQRSSARLREFAAEMAEAAGQVSTSAHQVASASQSLAQAASEQAASLEETSAVGEEVNSLTRRNAEDTKAVAGLMAKAQTYMSQVNAAVEQMVASMKEITRSSDKIAQIIKVIDEIAFQTNILSLNAAVEAARAGEAGMGFAVVADEVRSLAQRSAQAAKNTADLIEESIAKSNEGSAKLRMVTDAIQAITENSAEVKRLIEKVELGSEEQARGIDQIAKAVLQMEKVTQSTAAHAEQSASASEEMNSQASAMSSVVEQLVDLVGAMETQRHVYAEPSAPARPAPAAAPSAARPENRALAVRPSAVDRRRIPLEEDFKEF